MISQGGKATRPSEAGGGATMRAGMLVWHLRRRTGVAMLGGLQAALFSSVGLLLSGNFGDVLNLVAVGLSGIPFALLLGTMRGHEPRRLGALREGWVDILCCALIVAIGVSIGSALAHDGSILHAMGSGLAWTLVATGLIVISRLILQHWIRRRGVGELVVLTPRPSLTDPDDGPVPTALRFSNREQVRTMWLKAMDEAGVAECLRDMRSLRLREVVVSSALIPTSADHAAIWAKLVDGLENLPCPIWLSLPRSTDGSEQILTPLVAQPIGQMGLALKRFVDIMGSAMMLVMIAPLLATIALAIKIDSPGPVLFRQRRHGRNNDVFEILKFRSMSHAARDEGGTVLTVRGDSRVTRIGQFLRRSSLDELPQFFNVLMGDMSLVGPRPHPLRAHAGQRLYTEVVPDIERRHRVKPGITGLAQISGYRGNTDTEEKLIGRVRYDLIYIRQWSIWLDIKILLFTPVATLTAENAY